jgi:hypothetical protein
MCLHNASCSELHVLSGCICCIRNTGMRTVGGGSQFKVMKCQTRSNMSLKWLKYTVINCSFGYEGHEEWWLLCAETFQRWGFKVNCGVECLSYPRHHKLWDLRFLQRYFWIVKSSGMWHFITGNKIPDGLPECQEPLTWGHSVTSKTSCIFERKVVSITLQ